MQESPPAEPPPPPPSAWCGDTLAAAAGTQAECDHQEPGRWAARRAAKVLQFVITDFIAHLVVPFPKYIHIRKTILWQYIRKEVKKSKQY